MSEAGLGPLALARHYAAIGQPKRVLEALQRVESNDAEEENALGRFGIGADCAGSAAGRWTINAPARTGSANVRIGLRMLRVSITAVLLKRREPEIGFRRVAAEIELAIVGRQDRTVEVQVRH